MVKLLRKVKINDKRYIVRAIRTRYWRPGFNYLEDIARSLRKVGIKDGDIVFISEKAISTAKGNIVDEDKVKPSLLAKLIARIWMRFAWGYILGPLCGLRRDIMEFLRKYPLDYGARHKQVALRFSGFLNALCFGSEGGIDGSNLPYAYVCLPLREPEKEASNIREFIGKKLGVNVTIVIVDSDRCYIWNRLCISIRPTSIKGIRNFGGFITYVICNTLKVKSSPTPVAISGEDISLDELLKLNRVAEKTRGRGAGRSVWEMAARFGTTLTGVTWEMLESIPHYPIVIARRVY